MNRLYSRPPLTHTGTCTISLSLSRVKRSLLIARRRKESHPRPAPRSRCPLRRMRSLRPECRRRSPWRTRSRAVTAIRGRRRPRAQGTTPTTDTGAVSRAPALVCSTLRLPLIFPSTLHVIFYILRTLHPFYATSFGFGGAALSRSQRHAVWRTDF